MAMVINQFDNIHEFCYWSERDMAKIIGENDAVNSTDEMCVVAILGFHFSLVVD